MEKNSSSMFLSKVIKRLKLEDKYDAMLSYADFEMGHYGTIYQACGAYYIGISRSNKIILPDGRIIYESRNLFEQIKNSADSLKDALFVEAAGKHKYVLILNDSVRESISKLSFPYPKPNL
jgi:hypothetical protein